MCLRFYFFVPSTPLSHLLCGNAFFCNLSKKLISEYDWLHVHPTLPRWQLLYRKYNDLDKRLEEHRSGEGANHTREHGPVELIYFEEFDRIDFAFYREKQVQGWGRKKKEALINSSKKELKILAECQNESHYSLKLKP